jgi:hypothetical protein
MPFFSQLKWFVFSWLDEPRQLSQLSAASRSWNANPYHLSVGDTLRIREGHIKILHICDYKGASDEFMKLEDKRLTDESIEEQRKKRSPQDESIKNEAQDVGEASNVDILGNRLSPDVSIDSDSDSDGDSDTTVKTVKRKPARIPSSQAESSQSSIM